LARGRKRFYQLLNAHGYKDIRPREIRKTEPLGHDPNYFDFEIAVEKIIRHKSPGTDQIPAELIKRRVGQSSEIHKSVNFIWNENELPDDWKESIILLIYKKRDKTHLSDYRSVSLLSLTYKILYPILLPRLTPHVKDITGDHQCGFRCTSSVTHHIFWIRQTLDKKMGIQLSSAPVTYRLKKTPMIQLRGKSCLIFSFSLVFP
jgi:hypothetical protein